MLIDFGLAIDLAELNDYGADLSGTPFYMAPEAWRDAPPDPAWDAYALGVTAAVVLVGPPDLKTDLPSLRQAKLSGTFERKVADGLAHVGDGELTHWVARLLDHDPARRRAALRGARPRLGGRLSRYDPRAETSSRTNAEISEITASAGRSPIWPSSRTIVLPTYAVGRVPQHRDVLRPADAEADAERQRRLRPQPAELVE